MLGLFTVQNILPESFGRGHGLKTRRKIVKKLRSLAQECRKAARDYADEKLSEYLQEINVVLVSNASVLQEYDQ